MKTIKSFPTWQGFVRVARARGCLLAALLGVLPAWGGSTSLISSGAAWKYNATGTDLGTAWRAPDYDDSAWASGPSQLGYGDGDEATVLPLSPVRPCYYFRHTFTVDTPAIYAALSLEVLRDDGAVVYLNGTEVARYNMPSGTISYSTWASGASEYSWDAPREIPNLLVAGANVIAVEVHQGNSTSTDISLDLKLTGTSAISVTLDAPAAGATGVAIPATLSATATDPEGDDLTVSFHGRVAPPAVPDFTIVVLPDTQNYTAELNGGTAEMFSNQTQWIVDNREARNIVYVAHLGDVSNYGDIYPEHWLNATDALYRLDNAVSPLFPYGLPYGAAVGNHDQMVPSGDTEPTTSYNQYFGVAHYQGRPYYGGHYGANNNNQYQLFSASGLDFIVIYFEYDSTPEPGVLDWADALLKANPSRRGIVVTHYLLETTAAWGAQGLAIYNALSDNPNLFLMLCGHNHGEARRTDVYAGNTVHTLLADYQDYPNGGNGLLRILEFSPNHNEIRVSTYSPWLDQYETDADSQFTLSYPMVAGPAFELVQQPTVIPSGSPASAVWGNLQMGIEYEWYVSATDGAETATSEIRRFTTASSIPPTVAITSPLEGAVFPADPASVTIAASAADSDGTVARVEFFSGSTSLGVVFAAPYEVTALLALGVHPLTAVATDSSGTPTASAPVHITVGSPPTAPTDLLATAQSSTVILLNWTDTSSNESGFEIYQSVAGGAFTLVGTLNAETTAALVTGLAPSTTYDFTVRAFNVLGYADSVMVSATTQPPPPKPAAPSDLSATPTSGSEIALAWTDNSIDETGFHVERSLDGVAWALLGTVSANATTALDTGLSAGTVYYYRVLACNEGGCSEPTPLAAAAPFIDAYATSETLVAGTLAGNRVDTFADDGAYEQLTEKLSGGKPNVRYSFLEHKWTFAVTPGQSVTLFVQAHQTASSDGDNFVFAYSTDDVAYQDMVTISATADNGQYQSFNLPETLAGTVYVRVRDTDRVATHVTLDTLRVDHLLIRTDVSLVMSPPPAPVLLQAIPGDGHVTLTWSASSGATSYSVWRRSDGGEFANVATGVTETTYDDLGLANGTTYEYAVTAVNAYGESKSSNVLVATPQTPTVTEPPTNLTAVAAKKKINLTWVQSTTPGVTENRVYRSANGIDFGLLATMAPTTSYSDSVSSGSKFYYVVTAMSSAGESAVSNVAFATAK